MHKGALFTSEFLAVGVKATPYWKAIADSEVDKFRKDILVAFEAFPVTSSPNESTTERDLIEPIIKVLGWTDYLTQQTAAQKGRSDVPDYLLFKDAEHKTKANKEHKQADRYKHGLAIIEAKAWQIPLDRKEGDVGGVPSNQIIRYLSIVDVQSDKAVKWGILTNGREWRLYYQDAKSRSEEFLSLDLPAILDMKGFEPDLFAFESAKTQDWLKVFYAFFHKAAFIKEGPENRSFHENALAEGRYWETKVANDLSGVVFKTVLPGFAKGLAATDSQKPAGMDRKYLAELREATLILLYRLLFILYAEDRNLLPAADSKYDDYGLRKRVRDDIRKRVDDSDTFSETVASYYRHVTDLCKAVDKGDQSIGLPPYNGGLFDDNRAPILQRARITDAVFAPLFDRLSRHYEAGKKSWINYRDLSVQQLGSIYERFLEYELVLDDDGEIVIRPHIFSRKTTGSYYTPDSLVSLIIEKAIGPLINERGQAFQEKAEELKSSRGSKQERLKKLATHDPANGILTLRVLDPAMGSGHFLVSLVDYLADRLLILMEEAESLVDWADDKNPYFSPLTKSVKEIRKHILAEAKKHKWIVRDDQLDDRHLVRRMILKRCVFGVDKNPMAVELAKVSLWLHTFTVGAPLSFLDHHLRWGDSLFGEFTHDVEQELKRRGGLFISSAVAQAKATAKGMDKIESLTDSDIAEVKESADVFKEVSKGSRPLTRLYDVMHSFRWMNLEDTNRKKALSAFFLQAFGDPVRLASDGIFPKAPPNLGEQVDLIGTGGKQEKLSIQPKAGNEVQRELADILREAHALAEEEAFLHWEVAFPMVWDNWESEEPEGGFDAVIGNPPWDRMKLQEVEWFSARIPEIAYATRADDRKKLIKKFQDTNDPLAQAYEEASGRAKKSAEVARDIGHYPRLSGGDINLYSLFVERAHRLVKPEGFVGLVTPSGIASDKSASGFFSHIAGENRLAHFYDFENKKVFFPDIDSRFKFAVYVAGGEKRRFKKATMAFYLHNVEELEEKDRIFQMTSTDFKRVNPNTGTAPIFRTRRDAEITRRIYENFPILRQHGKDPVWPVKYVRMFDMTNDSHLFKTREELERDGYYPVEGNRLKKGKEEYLPLYVGKMIHHYDHRAASVEVNAENLKVAGSSLFTTLKQHRDPAFGVEPQYWVSEKDLRHPKDMKWTLVFRDITNSTNERTFIATILPRYGANNKLPVFVPVSEEKSTVEEYKKAIPLFCANLNAFAFDFVVRQKVHSTTLNLYIVEQLPVIPPEKFEARIGKVRIADLIRDHVLRLTYTAHDMKPFAMDLDYSGKPFKWDEEERRHLRARLDALFFLLYDIDKDDAAYIMGTFPIVKADDEREFGRYLTRDLILGYMNALSAGDTKSNITL